MLTDGCFDDLRAREFARLDAAGLAYLDYTGSALYARSQIDACRAVFEHGVFGNPHSEHAASRASTDAIAAARRRVLHFLDADAADYVVCFTANATAAAKLVGESYRFGPARPYVLSSDNHNSINGLREFARRAGAEVRYLPLTPDLELADPVAHLDEAAPRDGGLFAFPAQSNFSGVRHPLSLVAEAHARGFDVLLDAAAYVPSRPLSLRECPADFVVMSFYKVFGYPTGVGALIAKRTAMAALRRPWFAGGTVTYASVQLAAHDLRADADGFEDGTPNFLALLALEPGFAMLDTIGMPRVGAHVQQLASRLLTGLQALRHRSGALLVRTYGPPDMSRRGGIVTFNVLRPDGRAIPYAEVEARGRDARVSVRGGCFCNPGASEAAFGFRAADSARCLEAIGRGFTVERFAECLGPDVPVGAVRASVGLANNAADVDRAVALVASFQA